MEAIEKRNRKRKKKKRKKVKKEKEIERIKKRGQHYYPLSVVFIFSTYAPFERVFMFY